MAGSPSGSLAGRVAIVTGGASGLGRAGAIALARAGAAVAVADVDGDRAARVAADIESGGGKALAIACDVGVSARVQSMIERAVRELGRLDVLYNNAGIAPVGEDGPVAAMSEEAWERVLRVNLTSVFL